jgi:hypothetical protein
VDQLLFSLAESKSTGSGGFFDVLQATVEDSISSGGRMKGNCTAKVVTDVMYSFRVSKLF